MMGWYPDRWGMFGAPGLLWLLIVLFWAVLLGLIVYLAVKLFGSSKAAGPKAPGRAYPGGGESPEEVLDRMFVLGEIDEQTYRARRTALGEMRGSK